MATVRQSLSLQDQMSPVLSKIMRSMRSTMNVMEQMNVAAGRGIPAASFRDARRSITEAERALESFNEEQNDIPKKQEMVAKGFIHWGSAIVVANQALQLTRQLIDGIGKITEKTDKIMSNNARLKLINDGLQTQSELQDKIFQSAQRSRSAYDDTVEAVARINMLAKNAFPKNDEAIAFTETMQKAFALSGADTSEQKGAMRQMTQALASGRLQGDEFVSIRENAPMIAKAIQDTMGLSNEAFKEAASDGEITAEVIKQAVFEAADDINTKFEQLPVTVGQSMTQLKNAAEMKFQPLVDMFQQFLASPTFARWSNNALNSIDKAINAIERFVNWVKVLAATPGFQMMVSDLQRFGAAVGTFVEWFIGVVGKAISFITENWVIIQPILVATAIFIAGIAIALTIFQTAMAIATIAQWAFNSALFACPITWIVVAIIALIAIIVALTIWLIDLWQTNITFRVNVIKVWNGILNFFDQVPIFFKAVGYGIVDAFEWASTKSVEIVQTMANNTINVINDLIAALNMIPGVAIDPLKQINIAAKTQAVMEARKAARASEIASDKADALAKAQERDRKLEEDAAKWNKEAQAKKDSKSKKDTFLTGGKDPFDYKSAAEEAAANNPGGDGKIKGGKLDKVDEVGISDEDLKFLKDIASVEFINKYTTMRPVVTNQFGDIHETADVNQIITVVEDSIVKAYESALDRG